MNLTFSEEINAVFLLCEYVFIVLCFYCEGFSCVVLFMLAVLMRACALCCVVCRAVCCAVLCVVDLCCFLCYVLCCVFDGLLS